MSKPTKEEVIIKVKNEISEYTNHPVLDLSDDMELKKHPLKMGDAILVLLAMSLRPYVKKYDKKKTVFSKEVKKKGLTVKGLYELIYNKIK